MDTDSDTIAAIATPPGRGGVGIVRVSGPLSATIAEAICGVLPSPRQAAFRRFRASNGEILDQGIVLYFSAPYSFTGEDVLELHGHGSPVVMDLLLKRVAELGARLARSGEFSERAFLNDKLDLAQAEAVADLIACTTAEAARAALHSLQGVFSQRIHALVETLIELRLYVEAAIDFPEEEIDFLADGVIAARLRGLRDQLTALQTAAGQGRLLRDGMTVVIAGRPNAGKSSLLNQLAGRETAIVTEIAGTTRDILREHISIDGMPLHVIDTAGLHDSSDPIEREGVRRAWVEIGNADRILLLVDDRGGLTPEDQELREQLPVTTGVTVIHNKIDLTGRDPVVKTAAGSHTVWLSAKTGAGLELLREHLKNCMGYHSGDGGVFMARRRHLDALTRAAEALAAAAEQLAICAGELVAEELREAQNALSEITGEFSNEDLLERIFGSFCIGK
jgi:tRNA modification GTPase